MPDDATPVEPRGDELYCFKDAARICGPDCMAFLSFIPEGDDYKNQSWARCRLLVDSHRSAKHLVVLAQWGAKIANTLSNEAADRKRQPLPPPMPR